MKLNCYIVRDLLPSYIEKLTSEETGEDIRVHLEECKECAESFKSMSCELENMKSIEKVKPESLDYLKRIKIAYFIKIGLGTAVLLFAFVRFACCYMGVYNMLEFEAEFYILLITFILWYIGIDLFRTGHSFDKKVVLLHLFIMAVSIVTAVWTYRMIGITMEELDFLVQAAGTGEKVGLYMMNILKAETLGILLVIVYGVYASIIKSDKYFGLVSHGLGCLVMIYDLRMFIRMLSLPLNYSPQRQMDMFFNMTSYYAFGVFVTVFYYLFGKKITEVLRKRKWK